MAVKTRYISGTDKKVRGVKVTLDNIHKVRDWILDSDNDAVVIETVDRNGKSSNHRVRFRTPKGYRVARVGDVVAIYATGKKPKAGEFFVALESQFPGFVK